MGFYGNITNTNKTQFTFDRTYANRKTMEDRLGKDEIYLGRYVLIEYSADDGNTLDTYTKCYVKIVDGKEEFYTSPNFESTTRVKWGKLDSDGKLPSGTHVTTNSLIYVEKDLTPDNGVSTLSQVFYKCTNPLNSTTGANATFTLVVASEDPYTKNYNIDTSMYGAGRGYDSTVWQKVYSQGEEKYVMIAELNSVVPTFDITADAPTMTPITPHFDADSTNVYYKLHTQPAWGFRVAEAKASYNSDQQVKWTKSVYDPSTDITTNTTSTVRGAINFNAPAFSSQVGVSQNYLKKKDYTPNEITVLPTGLSGNEYNTHDGTGNKTQQPDIQELRINLPAIGNMMSDAWDIIHGPNRDNARTDENGSLQGRLDSFKDMAADEIPIKRGSDGTLIGATINGGKTTLLDYTGKNDDAWIETEVNGNEEKITIHHTFTEADDTTTTADKNTNDVKHKGDNAGIGDTLKLYTPIVDEMGHVVGNNIETVTLPYGYKKYTTNGVATAVTDLHTTITSAEDGADTDAVAIVETTSSTADNTQDTLAVDTHNKWIQTKLENDKLTIAHEIHAIPTNSNGTTNANSEEGASDENNINIPDWAYDEAGHITEKHDHFYTLPFGYKEITSGSASEAVTDLTGNSNTIVADKTQDTLVVAAGNKWIKTAADADTDTLSIAHEVHSINETPKDATYLDTTGNGAFIIQDLSFDKAGHVLTNQSHTYHLPHAIRNITVGVSSSTTEGADAAGTVSADTYNDTLTLNAQNRWVNLKADTANDIISIGHANAGTTSQSANLEKDNNTSPNFGDNIKVFTAGVDQMGHVKELSSYNIKLPTPSLNDLTATTSSVITGLSMNDTTGAITQTNNNVGNLVLTDYTTAKIDDTTYVQATDSINNAFNKVDTRIDTENTRATNAEKALNDRIDALDFSNTPESSQVVFQVVQTDGKINTDHKDVGTLTLKGYEIPESVSTLGLQASNTLNTALGKLEYRLNAEKSRAESAENDLNLRIDNIDYTDTASTTQIITKIDQTDGKIAVTRGAAGGLVLTNYSKATTASPIIANDSINEAFGKLEYKLDTETTRATSAENAINTNLTLEVNRAKKAEEDLNARIDGVLGGVTADELDTFKELSDALNDDTNFATTVNNAIAGVQTNLNTEIENRGIAEAAINKSIEDLSAQIGKNVEDESAVNKAITDRLDVLEKADYANITTTDITKWNAAEANVQSDWNETDTNADSFIKNKPIDLVRTADIANMATKSDIANMVETTTSFVYTPAKTDETTGETVPEESITIAQLIEKIKTLETRIIELEAKHAEDSNEEEIPTE